MLSPEPIFISAIGAVSGFGSGVSALWEGLCAGQSAISAPWRGGGAHPVSAVPGLQGPTSSDLAWIAAEEAVGAGVDPEGLAVIGASTSGDMSEGELAFAEDRREGAPSHPAHLLWRQLCHRPAAGVRARLAATGPCLTVSTACTSGVVAVGVALDLLRLGRARRALVVGADALCATTVHGFASLSASSPRPCRPFDRAREGMSLGEGAAVLLIEPASALSRPPIAELLGWATRSDASHLTAPDPAGRGAVAAMRAAIGPHGPVELVCAHGTGTPLNDAMEGLALAEAAPGASIFGIKGSIGHTLGAAGALELLVTALALREGRVPGTVGLSDPEFAGDFVAQTRASSAKLALSVNFAFGGHDAAVLVRACG